MGAGVLRDSVSAVSADDLIDPKLPPDFATTVRIGHHRAHATNAATSRTDVRLRDFTFVIDEPPERGGTNAGPSPLEYVAAALAG